MANGVANGLACVTRSKFLTFGGNLPDSELATAADDVAKAIMRARQNRPSDDECRRGGGVAGDL